MRTRPGKSFDWSEDRRLEAYDIFQKYSGIKTRKEIAVLIGISESHLYKMRHFKWWLELEKQKNGSIK